MPAKITFKVPTQKNGLIEKTGLVMIIPINTTNVKFVIQDGIEGESPSLTHYASGMTAVSSNSVAARKLSRYVANPYSTPLSNRVICFILMQEIIAKIGADKLMEKLNSAPVINS